MGKYFGTDGFRGEANIELTADRAYKIGRFIGWYYSEEKRKKGDNKPARVVIGKDTRRSGYMLEYALASGIVASGADGYLLHVITTPGVAYITTVDGFDCGIMISASHNPYYDNGIKLFNADGGKADGNFISLVEAYLDGEPGSLPFAKRDKIGKIVDYISGRNRYVGYLIGLGAYSLRGKKIGIDCANGSAWSIAKAVFEALGAETLVINASPDGTNINFVSGSTHPEALQKLVKENNLDIGFAFDGDADRCICVDEEGRLIDGDSILYICAGYFKKRGELEKNTVVTTVMSNIGLYKALDTLGIKYAVTDVGDKNVSEYMMKNGCSLGGEQSGHIIFSEYASIGDGLITSLKITEIMMAEDKKLSELLSSLEIYPQVLENVSVRNKQKIMTDEAVRAAVNKAAEGLGDKGRILVRESGTEPLIRVMVESCDKELCRVLAGRVVKVIEEKNN